MNSHDFDFQQAPMSCEGAQPFNKKLALQKLLPLWGARRAQPGSSIGCLLQVQGGHHNCKFLVQKLGMKRLLHCHFAVCKSWT